MRYGPKRNKISFYNIEADKNVFLFHHHKCDGLPRLEREMRNSFEMREEIVVIVLIVSFAASASLYCQDGMLGKLDGEHGEGG